VPGGRRDRLRGHPGTVSPIPYEPPDPGREPALVPRNPRKRHVGPLVRRRVRVEIRLNDGTWTGGELRGWYRERGGGWLCLLAWHHSSWVGGREGWFVFDPESVRPAGGPC